MTRDRLIELNDAGERAGHYVLYWMQQSQREAFNPALETAIACANRLNLPVLVGFGLTDGYPEANARHYTFMLEGLREVRSALIKRGIAFSIQRGTPDDVAIELAKNAALVVCDRGYLRHQKVWRRNLAERAGRRVLQVEADVVVPVNMATDAARLRNMSPWPNCGSWRVTKVTGGCVGFGTQLWISHLFPNALLLQEAGGVLIIS